MLEDTVRRGTCTQQPVVWQAAQQQQALFRACSLNFNRWQPARDSRELLFDQPAVEFRTCCFPQKIKVPPSEEPKIVKKQLSSY